MAQEAKTAVDVTAGGGGLPGSPAPVKRGSGSDNPLSPPPRTPESRMNNATLQSPSGGMVDRRQLFEGGFVLLEIQTCTCVLCRIG